MADEIVNRVANSKLITIDLEAWYPEGDRIHFDISPWLLEGLVLKESDFRDFVEKHPWQQYVGSYLALYCSTDAIIPSWAYLLITAKASPYAKKVVVGNLDLLETLIFQEIIDNLELEAYEDHPIIVKGCAEKPIPATAMVQLVEKIRPVAKTIMFGEACSTVPLYKKKSRRYK